MKEFLNYQILKSFPLTREVDFAKQKTEEEKTKILLFANLFTNRSCKNRLKTAKYLVMAYFAMRI